MTENELYWLAGLLEGEGSFCKGCPSMPNSPSVNISMTDKDVIERVGTYWHVAIHKERKKNKNPKHKTPWVTRLRGYRAIELMKKIRHLMSNRRQNQIDAAIESYHPKYHCLTADIVHDVKSLLKEGNLTQSQIALKFGIKRETVNRINRDRTGINVY